TGIGLRHDVDERSSSPLFGGYLELRFAHLGCSKPAECLLSHGLGGRFSTAVPVVAAGSERVYWDFLTRGSGGTGRRTSLRGWRSQERGGSNPPFRTSTR